VNLPSFLGILYCLCMYMNTIVLSLNILIVICTFTLAILNFNRLRESEFNQTPIEQLLWLILLTIITLRVIFLTN